MKEDPNFLTIVVLSFTSTSNKNLRLPALYILNVRVKYNMKQFARELTDIIVVDD